MFFDTPEFQETLKEAIRRYTNGVAYTTSLTKFNYATRAYECRSNISADGTPVNPNPPTPPPPRPPAHEWPPGGLRVALLDHATNAVLLSKDYYLEDINPPRADEIYHALHRDLAGVKHEGYRMIMSVFGVPVHVFPTPPIVNWLENCGAALQEWSKYNDGSAGFYVGGYVCIGRQGTPRGTAQEVFGRQLRDQPRLFPLSVSLFELMYAPARQG